MAGGSTRLVPVYLSFPRNGLRALSRQAAVYLGVIVFFIVMAWLCLLHLSEGAHQKQSRRLSLSLSAFGNHSNTHFQVNVVLTPQDR